MSQLQEGREEMTKPAGKKSKEKQVKGKSKIPLRVKYSPVPEFITCPRCGFEMELWSGGEETRCFVCGHKFFKREATIH